MSSTNRGGERRPSDYYVTPAWCIKVVAPFIRSSIARAVERRQGEHALVLDPGAGEGAITKALLEYIGTKLTVSNGFEFVTIPLVMEAVELEKEHAAKLHENLSDQARVLTGDFLKMSGDHSSGGPYDGIVCNPPYSIAMDFIKKALELSNNVWMLLRLDFLGSNYRTGRGDWYRDGHTPDVYVMDKRPSFTGGGNDSNSYGWMHFRRRQDTGTVRVLRCG